MVYGLVIVVPDLKNLFFFVSSLIRCMVNVCLCVCGEKEKLMECYEEKKVGQGIKSAKVLACDDT